MKLELNSNKTECTIGDVTLQVEQTIEYKSATDHRTSVGKIKAFQYAGYKQEDTSSVWMRIEDISQPGLSEWISCINWGIQNRKGLFGRTKTAPVKNENTQSPSLQGSPF